MALPVVHHVRARMWACHVVKLINPSVSVSMTKCASYVFLSGTNVGWVPDRPIALRVIQNSIRNRTPSLRITVGSGALPNDFTAKTLSTENRIKKDLEVVAHRRIAVEIE